MTSKAIYLPFTYCITFTLTGQRYYGVRYAKGCHPDQLWSTYFTSSKVIKTLIKEHGKDSFVYQVRKTFSNKDSANSWETKFLTRIDAASQDSWFNKRNGSSQFYSTPESVQKGVSTRIKNGSYNSWSAESIEKALATRIKNGTMNSNTPETVQKCKDTKALRGIESPMKSPETAQKAKESRKRNGTMNTNTPDSIQKARDTKKERGIINPALIPFLSMIHNKKTYPKHSISQWFSDLKVFY